MDTLTEFLQEPTPQRASFLDMATQHVVYGWATYCVKNKTGETELAKRIRTALLPELKRNTCFDHRGLRSLLLGCRLLLNFKPGQETYLTVTVGKQIALQIYYGVDKSLSTMYLVKQTHDMFGVDKELVLYYEGLADYLKELFMDFPDMRVNLIDVYIAGQVKAFYTAPLGVVWNEEKCAECTMIALGGKPMDKGCKKLYNEKCYQKFRYAPTFVFKDAQPKRGKPSAWVQTGQVECQTCGLMNPKNSKKCTACGENI